MSTFLDSSILLLMLLNPFFVILYLIDVIRKKTFWQFTHILISAGILSFCVFSAFAILGDVIFISIFQAEFASFQIFGGVIFLIIGIQFVFKGTTSIDILRGDSSDLKGAIAMPVMIGPGTISASVLAGQRLDSGTAILSIFVAISLSIIVMILLKALHDYVRPKNEKLIESYAENAGRIMALYIGTFSVEMVMKGVRAWISKF